MSGSLDGRIVLVTGATRGLGAAVAEACAAAGAQLVLVGRTRGALEEVDDRVRRAAGTEEGALLVPLDLEQGELVDRLGGPLFERFGRLDGVVSCAGELGVLTPVAQLEPQRLAQVVAVNLLAQQRLIRSLDPLLRAAPAGRAVFITCAQAREHTAYWGAYAASKAALEALVITYAAELRLTRVRANLVDPGPMATRLRARAFPGERPGARPAPEALAPRILPLLSPTCEAQGEIVRL